jgi:replication initiation protein RepC
MKAKTMDRQIATTPFGRRPVTLGQIASQMKMRQTAEEAGKPGSNHPAVVNKWQLFRTLTEVRERLGVSDRSLSVLNALLSFHQETALTLPKPRTTLADGAGEGEALLSCDLVVFPSNRALTLRAHGMASRTLGRHLAALVEAGLILRRDSPNGKRYARKAGETVGGGRFSDAFGFDLTPLVTRAPEFEAMADDVRRLSKARMLTKERISLLRRDAGKLIACGLDEGLPGDWEALRLRCMALMTPVRRLKSDAELEAMAADLTALRDDAAKTLESNIDVQNMSGNDSQNGVHQSNSKSKWPSDLEPASEEEGHGAEALSEHGQVSGQDAPETRSYPLGMVMEACPDIRDYAPGGKVRSWSDFLEAARSVRPMIGISPDAFAQAQQALGETEAHVAVAMILQRSVHSSEAETGPGPTPGSLIVTVNGSPAIQSAGGYLRALTEKGRAGEFALGPVLMALIGQRLKVKRARGQRQ